MDSILELVKRRKEPFELRARLLGRAKKRFATHLDIKHADKSGTKLVTLLQLSVGPRFPSRQLCRPEELKGHIQNRDTLFHYRDFLFPDVGSAVLSQHESAIVLDAARGTSFLEINVWGLMFYGAHIWFASGEIAGIDMGAFLGYVLLFIRHAAKMLQALGFSGSIAIEITLTRILKMRWLDDSRGYMKFKDGSELDDEVTLTIPTSTEALRDKPDRVAMEIFRHVFFSVNMRNLVDPPEKLEELLKNGFDYNGWQSEKPLI